MPNNGSVQEYLSQVYHEKHKAKHRLKGQNIAQEKQI
jgi:hypothetical protein